MTGLIGSIVGAASTAVERLTGTLQGKETGAAGEFSSLLASMTGAAPAAAAAVGRPRDFRLGSAGDTLTLTPPAGDADEAEAEHAEAAALHNSLAAAVVAQPHLSSRLRGGSGEIAGLSSAEAEVLVEELPSEAKPSDEEVSAAIETTEALLAADESAAAAALEETKAISKDLNGLDPEFRRRLERVMDRMKAEFGHTVNVVEGYRTQERQNQLYQQGRSKPGPVVTWTRNSNHTQGRAVDVMIDGTYNNPTGYQRLAQIAAEEGLRTLGARDPGHVELPRSDGSVKLAGADSRAPIDLRPEALPQPERLAQQAGVARVARVAEVAQVADVARVAEVARVADPMRQAPTPSASVTPSPNGTNAAAAMLGSNPGFTGGDSNSSSGRERQGESGTPSASELEFMRADSGLGRSFSSGSGSVGEAQFTSGTDAVQRAAQILAMKEGAANAPVNHLLLRIDSPNGGEDRIRVDLRGMNVDTTLNIGNAGEAEQLASKVGELRQSLERHGLEAEAVRIRTTTGAGERIEATRAVLSAAELEGARQSSNGRAGSDSTSSRDPHRDPQEQLRRESSDSRQRSRKEQPQEEKA